MGRDRNGEGWEWGGMGMGRDGNGESREWVASGRGGMERGVPGREGMKKEMYVHKYTTT